MRGDRRSFWRFAHQWLFIVEILLFLCEKYVIKKRFIRAVIVENQVKILGH